MENSEQIEQAENISQQPSSKRKYVLLGIIVILVLLIGAGVLGLQHIREQNEFRDPHEAELLSPQQEEQTVTEQIDTSEWQTYRNNEFEFELSYPQEWLNASIEELDDTAPDGSFVFSNSKKEVGFYIFVGTGAGNKELFELVTNANVGDILETDLIIYTKLEDAMIDGYATVRYVADRTADPALTPSILEEILLEKEGKIFHFFEIGSSEEAVAAERDTLDAILSTFRFVDTSIWQTYTNEEFGYEVKYPGDWKIGDIYTPSSPRGVKFTKITKKDGEYSHHASVRIIIDGSRLGSTLKEGYLDSIKSLGLGIDTSAYKFEETIFLGYDGLIVNDERLIFTKDTVNVFRIEWDVSGDYDESFVEYTEQTSDEILSTFRFIE